MEYIGNNLKIINERIAKAAIKSGRKPEDITLIAVTKTIEPDQINEAIRHGITDLGENRVQELLRKKPAVNPAKWHMIGHLQRNKVRMIIDQTCLIHSLDSPALAEEIQKNAEKQGIVVDALIEINIMDEQSKFGVKPEDAAEFAGQLEKYGNIRLRGLMCVAPFVEIAERNRDCFRQMCKILLDIREQNRHNSNMNILSMGMSNDFEIAIEEGANMVRIGTSIFGERF